MGSPSLPRLLPLLALALSGCLAPALAPIRPMTATAAGENASREYAGTLGYAPAPGAGLGDSVIPGTPFVEGEIRFPVSPQVQITASGSASFQRYFLPWPSSVGLGSKITAYQDPDLALALAPRVVGASALNFDSGNGHTVLGTRSLGFELPVLATHRFANQWALTGQLWGRYLLLHQEDNYDTTDSSGSGSASGPVSIPSEGGHVWGLGAAAMFSFPKIHNSNTRYHLFLGIERLWLTQTSASNTTGAPLSPFVELSRFSLVLGIGVTTTD